MKIKSDLYKELNKIIETEYKNKAIMENINVKFMTKDINARGVISVWNEGKSVDELNDIELMAFTEAIYEILKTKELKLEEYFTENEILNYKSFVNYTEEGYVSDVIVAKYAKKLSDGTINCTFTYKELYMMKKNSLTYYNKMTQRACDYKELGTTGYKVKTNYIDRKKVDEIKALMKKEDYKADTIHFNIRLMSGKTPQVSWEDVDQEGNVGHLTIKPNYDFNSDTTTFVDRIDGNHRFNAAAEAFEEVLQEKGIELQGELICAVVMLDEVDARALVERLFKRSSTDEQWLRAMQNDDYNKFVNNICNKLRRLEREQITETWDEMKFEGAITNKRILVDAVQKTDIQVNQMSVQAITSKKFAEYIDLELELLVEQSGKTLNELKETILKPHFFGGLIMLINELKNEGNDEVLEYLMAINEKILNNVSELESLKLDNKNVNNERVYNYFKNLI